MYFGGREDEWDLRFAPTLAGKTQEPLIRFDPETVVIRDQSYSVRAFIKENESTLKTKGGE